MAREAPGGFVQWRLGEPSIASDGSRTFETDEVLPGAAYCSIVSPAHWSTPSYGCFWDTESASIAQQEVARLADTLKTCPGIVRGLGGFPTLGTVQFRTDTLASSINVVSLSAVDTRGLNAEAEQARSALRFPNQNRTDDFCGAILLVAQAAQVDFAEWRSGPPTQSDAGRLWSSSHRLPGAASCRVGHSEGNPRPFFGCHWTSLSPVAAQNDAERLTNAIRTCPEAQRSPGGHPRILGATFFVDTPNNNPNEVRLIVSPGNAG